MRSSYIGSDARTRHISHVGELDVLKVGVTQTVHGRDPF